MTINTPDLQTPFLHDIRKSSELLDLRSSILAGLSQSPKTLSSLLLWDEEGLKNFNAWTLSPEYYPKAKEMEILDRYKRNMADSLPNGSALVELGCG
jgi:uncharacterized SAM-dependent methyltransferase